MATVRSSLDTDKASNLLHPFLLHALAVSTKKQAASCRDDLAPGQYDIDAAVSIQGLLTVGENSVVASSVTPQPEQLLALVLGKLNATTREKLLRELPSDFAANGNEMPKADESLVESVQDLLTRLRREVTRTRRGSVTGDFDVKAIPALVMSRLEIAG